MVSFVLWDGTMNDVYAYYLMIVFNFSYNLSKHAMHFIEYFESHQVSQYSNYSVAIDCWKIKILYHFS